MPITSAAQAPFSRYMLFPLMAALIWSVNMSVTKLAADVIPPAAIGFYRWVLAGAILTPFVLPPVWRKRREIAPHLAKLAVLGGLGMAMYQGLSYVAAETTTATNMGIVTSTIPLITIAMASLLLRERPSLAVVAGGVLSLAGLLILMGEGNPLRPLTQGVRQGDMLMAVAALSYAVYGVLLRRWPMPLTGWQSLYVQIAFGVLFQLPAFLAAPAAPLNPANIPLVLYAGTFASLAAPFCWMQGVRHLGPNRTSIFLNLMPVGTLVIAALWLGEVPHAYHLAGGLLAVAGVLLAQLAPARGHRAA